MRARSDCPVCGERRLGRVWGIDWLGRCRSCGMVFAGKVPGEGELVAHYDGYPPQPPLSELTRLRYRELLAGFEHRRQMGRLIDVGCGAGHFLQAARDAGWEAVGTELPDQYLSAEHGIRVVASLDELEPAGADVVTMLEVVEHLPDPGTMLEAVRRVLRPGGELYMTTPNFASLSRRLLGARWRVIDYPEHLMYFSAAPMRRLLRSRGFFLERVWTSGLSLSELRRRGRSCGGGGAPEGLDATLRAQAVAQRGVGAALTTVNHVLAAASLGDTLKVRAVAPARANEGVARAQAASPTSSSPSRGAQTS